MAQRRILWLDQLKAVGFFLVILGHMDIPGALNGWIYSFHMPLFFLVSGFTLNLKKPKPPCARRSRSFSSAWCCPTSGSS